MSAAVRLYLTVVAAGLMLGGCGALGSRDQGSAGLTVAEVEWCPSTEAGQIRQICALALRDGKEKQSVTLSVRHPSGIEISYSASGVKAFDAIVARAEVEKALATAGVEVTPSILDLVLKAVGGI